MKFYWNTKAAADKVPEHVQRWFWNPDNRLVADLEVSLPDPWLEVVRRRFGLDSNTPVGVHGSWWNGSYHDPFVAPHPVVVVFRSRRRRIKHPFSKARKIARAVYEVYEVFRKARREAAACGVNAYEGG